MVELFEGLPETVVAFRGKGTITASDYENVIIPAVESRLEKHPKLRVLFHLGADFAGFEPGALWDDAKLGFGHLGAWERIAIVSDRDWVRGLTKLFGLAMPGRVRVFRDAELEAALQWSSGSS